MQHEIIDLPISAFCLISSRPALRPLLADEKAFSHVFNSARTLTACAPTSALEVRALSAIIALYVVSDNLEEKQSVNPSMRVTRRELINDKIGRRSNSAIINHFNQHHGVTTPWKGYVHRLNLPKVIKWWLSRAMYFYLGKGTPRIIHHKWTYCQSYIVAHSLPATRTTTRGEVRR